MRNLRAIDTETQNENTLADDCIPHSVDNPNEDPANITLNRVGTWFGEHDAKTNADNSSFMAITVDTTALCHNGLPHRT